MYSIIEPFRVERGPTGDMPRGLRTNVCRMRSVDQASAESSLLQASSAREVETPSKRSDAGTLWFPLRAVFYRKKLKKPPRKMSNMILIDLYCSNFPTPLRRRLCRRFSTSNRRPVILPNAVLGGFFSAAGKGVKFIVAVNRVQSHTQSRHNNPAQTQATTRFDAVFESKHIDYDNMRQ